MYKGTMYKVQSTKGKTIVKSRKSKVKSEESHAGDRESGESHSPEKEERRVSGLNPDEMNITLRGGNGLWMGFYFSLCESPSPDKPLAEPKRDNCRIARS